MKRLIGTVLLGLSLSLTVRAGYGADGGIGGLQPAMALARVDDRGMLHVRIVTGQRAPDREITIKRTTDKGEIVLQKVLVGRQSLDELSLTLPLAIVKRYDTEGKTRDTRELSGLLKSEKPILVIWGPPDVKALAAFKPDLPVLTIPVGYGAPEVIPAPRAPIPRKDAPRSGPEPEHPAKR
jgi:hypothetical protein